MNRIGRGVGISGNIMFIIASLMAMFFIGVVSVGFLTRTDISTTSNFLRELLATHLAESIATQIEAQTSSRPWKSRFWLLEAQKAGTSSGDTGVVPTYSLKKGCPYVNLSKDTLSADEYDFIGVVKDLAAELRAYRIYLEVTLRGETYAFSFDKRWSQTLLSGFNQDGTLVDKPMGLLDGSSLGTDKFLDNLKAKGQQAVPPDGSNQEQVQRLTNLHQDEKSFKGNAIMPGPKTAPSLFPPKGP